MPFPHNTAGNEELEKICCDFVEWDAFVAGLADSFVYHNTVQKKYTYMHEGMAKETDPIIPKQGGGEAVNYFKKYNKRLDDMMALLKEIMEEEGL